MGADDEILAPKPRADVLGSQIWHVERRYGEVAEAIDRTLIPLLSGQAQERARALLGQLRGVVDDEITQLRAEIVQAQNDPNEKALWPGSGR